MKNAEQPAYPVDAVEAKYRPYDRDSVVKVSNGSPAYHGLTKREQFAAMAMQGLLANARVDIHEPVEYAFYAVKSADALLAELEKPKGGSDE